MPQTRAPVNPDRQLSRPKPAPKNPRPTVNPIAIAPPNRDILENSPARGNPPSGPAAPPVSLRLSLDRLQTLHDLALRAYPRECCGILLGRKPPAPSNPLGPAGAPTELEIVELWPAANAWDDRGPDTFPELAPADPAQTSPPSSERRYAIAPETLLAAIRHGRDRGLSAIGIYHSHPDAPATPSAFDRAYAWPEYSYIIVSVDRGVIAETRSWRLDDSGQFRAEPLAIAP